MIESRPRTIRVDDTTFERSHAKVRRVEDLGIVSSVGEIVDSKCYLGVMHPGRSKPHRACAVRCVAGGVPPMFVVHGAWSDRITAPLVSDEGHAVNQAVLDFVAEPVEIGGLLLRDGGTLILRSDPATYRRLK
jgi:hypothetical protein